MDNASTKCPNCLVDVLLDPNGDCPSCRRNIIESERDSSDELQFYCVVCEDFFHSYRDDTDFDQAPCPICGDLSNTTEFHVGEMHRDHQNQQATKDWGIRILLKIYAILFATGLGLALLKIIF